MANELRTQINWSKDKFHIGEQGHVIFKVQNISDKKILLYGYKMDCRQDGDISFIEAKMFNMGDKHFTILLWPSDLHEFHWNNVRITENYTKPIVGIWKTFLQICYVVDEGNEPFELQSTSIEPGDIEII